LAKIATLHRQFHLSKQGLALAEEAWLRMALEEGLLEQVAAEAELPREYAAEYPPLQDHSPVEICLACSKLVLTAILQQVKQRLDGRVQEEAVMVETRLFCQRLLARMQKAVELAIAGGPAGLANWARTCSPRPSP
jgi:hypothetical protein